MDLAGPVNSFEFKGQKPVQPQKRIVCPPFALGCDVGQFEIVAADGIPHIKVTEITICQNPVDQFADHLAARHQFEGVLGLKPYIVQRVFQKWLKPIAQYLLAGR